MNTKVDQKDCTTAMTLQDENVTDSPFDMVVHNGTIVTVNADFEIIRDGILCIRDGIIQQILRPEKNGVPPAADHLVDAGGGLMPGLINTHTHLPMALFRGMADDLPLMTWLNEHIFPAERQYLNEETVRWGTLISCSEMLLSGTTTCCDAYFFEDVVAQAVRQSGIRGILSQGVIDFPAPGVPDPGRNLEESIQFVEKWKDICPTLIPSIFCHSPYTCSAETLRKAKQAAREHGILFQMHAAETRAEWDQIHAEHGVSPIRYLAGLGLLDNDTLLAHTVWIDTDDISLIAEHGCGISHNPSSNMKLASGVAPIPAVLEKGIRVGLGTDGCASNNTLDLLTEMDLTAKLHKVHTLDPTVMDARRVIQMATVEGAKAIGQGDHLGSLEPGKQADLIILDMERPHLTPMYHAASHIVYAAIGSDVRDVIIAGEPVVCRKKLLTIDTDQLLYEIRALFRRLF
jgi:5-methylthioadenosine/S-adenosylhomocysteine deaminase